MIMMMISRIQSISALSLFSFSNSSMYPSSSASSSSSSQPHNSSISQTGLTRYGSAPGSLLTSTVDAIIAGGGGSRIPPPGHYFSGECKDHHRSSSSYEAFDGSALVRQKSSPAGFLAHLADHNHNHNAGFTITTHGGGGGGGQECLSRISENPATTAAAHTQSYGSGGGGGGGWGENSNSIAFSAKRSRTNNDADILHCLNALESQFSLPQTTLEMASVDHLLHIPEDSVPCKIRAKRGMATHPRSIAERERRTRISGKLKKLQDLVPNMDKQTSYADMLDLAVQHIKGLQGQVQKLHKELENCTCGCQEST